MSKEILKGSKMKGRVDHVAARELFLFIQNDFKLYQQEKAIDANLRKKLKRGVFDKALAVKLFMYLADAGATKYVQGYAPALSYSATHGRSPRPSVDAVFNRKTRFAVAAMLTRYWIDARRNEGVQINPGCDSCQMLSINGVPCHETGCRNAWQHSTECKWCGQKFMPEERNQKFCDDSCYRSYNGLPEENPTDSLGRPLYRAAEIFVNNAPNIWVVMKRATPGAKHFNGEVVARCRNEAAAKAKAAKLNAQHGNPISKRLAHRLTGAALREAERRGWIKNPARARPQLWQKGTLTSKEARTLAHLAARALFEGNITPKRYSKLIADIRRRQK